MDNQIDVLGLVKWDWANSGYRYTKSLQRLGLRVESYKGTPLAYFNYPNQLPTLRALGLPQTCDHPITNAMNRTRLLALGFGYDHIDKARLELQELLDKSKCLYLFGSQWITGVNINAGIDIVVQHGGQTYRNAPALCNRVFNPVTTAVINQCPDLMGLGAENEHLIYYPVDTEFIQPDFNLKRDDGKLVIGHFPSNPLNKGTITINKVVDKLATEFGDKFIYNGVRYDGNIANKLIHGVDWVNNLKRLKSVDILIETCQTTLDNNGSKVPFGEWGNTALEGSASGTIVVTNSLTPELYKKEYGDCALQIMNGTEEGLEEALRHLLTQSPAQLIEKKRQTREWAVKKHSIEAVALRLWDKVFKHIFRDKWGSDGDLKQHAIDTWPKEFINLKGWAF